MGSCSDAVMENLQWGGDQLPINAAGTYELLYVLARRVEPQWRLLSRVLVLVDVAQRHRLVPLTGHLHHQQALPVLDDVAPATQPTGQLFW